MNRLTNIRVHCLHSGQQSLRGRVLVDTGSVVVGGEHRGIVIHIFQEQEDIGVAEAAAPVSGPGNQVVYWDPLPVQQGQGF